MNEYLFEYLEILKNEKRYSLKTVDSYKRDIEKFMEFMDKEGASFKELDIIIIRNFLSEELRNGITKRSCKRRISACKGFWKFLVKKGVVDKNDFIMLNPLKTERKFPHALYKVIRTSARSQIKNS